MEIVAISREVEMSEESYYSLEFLAYFPIEVLFVFCWWWFFATDLPQHGVF